MIIADFSSGDAVVRTEGLFQWDLGQQLKIIGLSEVTNVSQVHFANNRMRQAIVKRGTYENGALTVDIPNEFLQYGGPIPGRAWVYIYRSDTVGYTVKTVHIPIIERSRPNDYVSPTDPDSQGIVKAAMELLENYQTDLAGKLDDATGSVENENIHDDAVTEAKLAAALRTKINAKMDADDATVYHVDTTTQTLTYDNTNPKTIYLNARVSYGSVSNRAAVVISTSSKGYQFAITITGDILMRSGGGTYPTDWTVLYGSSYKKNVINDDNKNSSVFIPTIGAVVSYLVANYIGNGSGTVTENNLATALKNSLYHVDNTTENVIYSADNPRIIYTNARVNGNKPTLIFTLGDDSQLAMHKDGNLYCRTYANGAYGSWIDLKAMSIGESNKTSGAYPTVQAVYNFVTAFVASAISGKANTADVNTALNTKEDLSNKVPNRTAMDNLNSETQYPSIKTMVQYTDEKVLGVIDSTLSTQGAAADAKVTGDNIRGFYGAINPVLTTVNGKRIVSTTGEIATQEEYSYIEINAVPGLIISGYTRVSPSIYYGAAFYGSSNEYISGAYNDSSVGDWNYSLTAPENAVKLRISCRTNYLSQFTAKFAEFSTSAIVAINNNADDIKHLSAIENEIYFKADAEVAYNTDVEMTLENGVINKKGTTTYTGDANYRHARIDDLRPNDSYQITGICVNNSNYTYPLLSIIDSANNVISTPYTGANGQITNFAFTIPENADHMFVNFKIDNPYGLKKGSPMTVPQSIEKLRLEESGLSNFYEKQNRRALYNLSFNAPFVWRPFDKAYISWNNDDARSDMPLYRAVCGTYGVPYGNAVPYEKIAQNPTIGDTPLIEYLQSIIASGGEVFSHALTWLTANATDQDFYHQFITAKRTLETALGREINGIIQAGGSGYSGADYHKCQEYSISYYQFSDGYGVTPQYTLTRTRFLRSSYSSDAEQVNAYKAAIDDAVTNHKWLRLWCHGTDEVSIDVLTQVFQYAQTYIDRGLLSFTTWQNMYDTFRSHT